MPESETRVEGGRAAHPVVELGDGLRAVVRGFRRGGLVRHLNRDLYFLGDRAFQELRVAERARAAGVRTPRVLAATRHRAGPGYRATLATEWIRDGRDLADWLRDADDRNRRRALEEAGRQIGVMHGAGIEHPDLNLRNFLVREGEGGRLEVWLLDFDRARARERALTTQERAPSLHRLGRSARKLGLAFTAEDWSRLARGYGPAWPFATPERG